MRTALLLIAHGSRLDAANEELRSLAHRLRAEGAYQIVEPCYLELAQPDIPAGARRCVQQEAERIILLPYFLSAGTHVRRDLEAAREQLGKAYPELEIRLAEPIGLHPLIPQIVLERARQADSVSSAG